MIICYIFKNRRKIYNFIHYNRRSLQCLTHQNVRIAREWNVLAIGRRRHVFNKLELSIPLLVFFVHIHILTFSSNVTIVCTAGLKSEHRLFNK